MKVLKTHYFKSGRDCRDIGQTDFEYTHTTYCDYVRLKVTRNSLEVDCKLCLRAITNQLTAGE